MTNSHSSTWLGNSLSLLRDQDPLLAARELMCRQPDLVRHCPPNLHDFIQKIIGTLKVDNEPFHFDRGHEYLIEPYKAIAAEGHEKDDGDGVVLMCGAQVGKTVMAMMAEIWMACYWWGKYFGYFFPDESMAMITSGVRFKPLALSIPEIAPLWGFDPTADKEKRKSDEKRVRSIGPSQIFFSYMGGKTSTESIPLLGMVFDEVRRMLDGDRERARERMSHSPYPFEINISTAGYPEVTIDGEFRRSNMHKFHSRCKCREGVVLADVFPNCVGEYTPGHPKYGSYGANFWVCPSCGEVIDNPRDGIWVPHNSGARARGYHIPQILSPRQNANKIFDAFLRATDITEFYNSKLGIPHIAKDAQIVNLDILRRTVDPDLRWPAMTGQYPRGCAMGVDQMMGFNVVVIRELGPKMLNGLRESRLVHLEWVADPTVPDFDPWERCSELMKLYDVEFCVVDAMPNGNEALKFALKEGHKGRVFLADYSFEAAKGEDICVWEDKVIADPNRKASNDTKLKYRVRISRYHGIEWNLMRYVHRIKRQPHEKGLLGLLPDIRRKMVKDFMCATFWKHLMAVARRKRIVDETQDKFKMVFENIGLDPHFLHADLYCELALTRIREGGGAFEDYAKAAEPDKPAVHNFKRLEGSPDHWHCEDCDLTVAVPPGTTPGEVAEKAGFTECKK